MSDDNIIHVSFGRGGGRLPAPHRRKPSKPPEATSRPRSKDPLGDLYSVEDASRLFGLSASRLRHWERSGFIQRSLQVGKRRFYTFQDLIGLRTAKELLDSGVPVRNVRRSVDALKRSLPEVARPLGTLRIVADGGSVFVKDDLGRFDPTTGQAQLDFEVSELRDDVVRVLRRAGRRNDYKLAYEHYLEGCRLDEDESTFEQAEKSYRKAIELDPSLANALTNLGNLLFRKGELVEAEQYYARALQIDADQPEAFYNLGFLLYERGDLAGAVLNFRRALRTDSAFADAHFNLAMALTDLNKRDEARGHWETYLKLDPDSPWADVARRHLRR